jgi:hypothetical protein
LISVETSPREALLTRALVIAHFADGERLFRSIVIGRFGDRERSGATPVSLFL